MPSEEEDLFDDDIDDELMSRVAEESLAATQQSWNSASPGGVAGQSNVNTSFTATQLTHNTKVTWCRCLLFFINLLGFI